MDSKLLAQVEAMHGEIDKSEALKKLNALLNSEPNKAWVKELYGVTRKEQTANGVIEHPVYSLPIEKIEFLLTSLFLRWRVDIQNVQHFSSYVCTTVRLSYFNPALNEWDYQEGVGAYAINANSSAQTAVPASEAFAIKDASKKIGKVFGKDLNRSDIMPFIEGKKTIAKKKSVTKATKAGTALKKELAKKKVKK